MFENSTFSALPVRLVRRRAGHLCWKLDSGEVLLLGGKSRFSIRTTERVSEDGSSSKLDFILAYPIQ